MANEYEKIALATRKKVSKLTLEQQRHLLKLYEDSIGNLASQITRSKDKSLNQRWLTDYQKELKRVSSELAKDIKSSTENAIGNAAKIGTETERQIMAKIFEKIGLDTGDHFTSTFSQIQNRVIEDIISGNLYKDKKTLSQRIWNHSEKLEKDIQYVINQGILEKKSALELARDLEQFVREPAKRPWEWRKVYPNMGNTRIDYNAQRLARTSINHAYQNSSIQSSGMNPFVEGIEWRSAQIHGRTCDLCFERHGQIFPKDDVPLDHANGLCTMLPHILKSLDEVADELKAWIDGGDNQMLDKWYNEHGEHFSGIKINSIKNITQQSKNIEHLTISSDNIGDLERIEKAINQTRDIVEEYKESTGVDVVQLWKEKQFRENENFFNDEHAKFTEWLLERSGYNGLPETIDNTEGLTQLFRGVSDFSSSKITSKDLLERFNNGKFDISGGFTSTYGRGMYFGIDEEIAKQYANKGKNPDIITSYIKNDTRMLNHDIILQERKYIKENSKLLQEQFGGDLDFYNFAIGSNHLKDKNYEVFAAVHGYDGLHIDRKEDVYVVIFNRTALGVKK